MPDQTNEATDVLGAIPIFTQLALAGLINALAERGAIDPERVFALYRTLGAGLVLPGNPHPQAGALAAHALAGIERLYETMRTIPPGAGRA